MTAPSADAEQMEQRRLRHNEQNRQYRKRHPEKGRAYFASWAKRNPRHYVKRAYGITPQAWSELFEAQGRRCAICETTEAGRGWHTDHDHQTKAIRGILCHGCNTALGLFKDSTERLRAAAEYLVRSRAT